MKKIIILTILLFTAVVCYGADGYEALLETAENNFISGNYLKTIEIYETLIQIEKVNDPYVYYNLSNAYYRNGALGKAVLNIEKAFLLKPCDKDIRHNRKFLKMKAGVKEEEGFTVFLNFFAYAASLNTFTAVSCILASSVLSLSSLYFIRRRKKLKKVIYGLIALFALFAVLTGLKIKDEIFNIKAVALENAVVRSGPGPNNPEIFDLPEGRIISVEGEKSGWNHIKIAPEGFSGWIQSAEIEKING